MSIKFLEKYKGIDINQATYERKFKVFAIMPIKENKPIFHNHLSGSSIQILKNKIDRYLK